MNKETATDNENSSIAAVGALVLALAVVSVAARFYTRHFTKAGFGWDDWLILLALIVTIVTDILELCGSSYSGLNDIIQQIIF